MKTFIGYRIWDAVDISILAHQTQGSQQAKKISGHNSHKISGHFIGPKHR